MTDPSKIAEERDAVVHLAASGFARLLVALSHDRVYTKKGSGRLILSAVARRLKISPRRAAALLKQAREALEQ